MSHGQLNDTAIGGFLFILAIFLPVIQLGASVLSAIVLACFRASVSNRKDVGRAGTDHGWNLNRSGDRFIDHDHRIPGNDPSIISSPVSLGTKRPDLIGDLHSRMPWVPCLIEHPDRGWRCPIR